jgi:hypothetical protein
MIIAAMLAVHRIDPDRQRRRVRSADSWKERRETAMTTTGWL